MLAQVSLDSLSDDALLARLAALVAKERRVESEVIAHIAEVDARRLYLGKGCASMHAYCCEVLHLSEGAAFQRIRVARAARRVPALLSMLADGRLHLSGAALLVPHLGNGDDEALLARAVHRSKRDIEKLIAEIAPKPRVAASMRKLPGAKTLEKGAEGMADPASQPAELFPGTPGQGPARAVPLAAERYKVQFTATAALHDKLVRAQALTRHRAHGGDLAEVIDEAVTALLQKLEARRFGLTSWPKKTLEETDTRATSRHIPAMVRRAVYARDQGRCTFVDAASGRRCTCADPGRLEYHHVTPFAVEHRHDPERICLRCRAHNLYQAELDFGKPTVDRYRRSSRASEPSVRYLAGASARERAGGWRERAGARA